MSTDDTTPLAHPADETARLDDLTPTSQAAAPTPPPRVAAGPVSATAPSGPRVGTVVWGLVLALVGIGVTAIGAGAALDVQAALIALLVVAGTALLVGAVVTARRATRS
jgi:hypothetical protein